MSKLRIAYVNNTGEFLGGAELSLLDIVLHLDKDRYEPVVILPDNGDLAGELSKKGVEVVIRDIPVFENRLSFMWQSYKFAKFLKGLDIGMIHGNSLSVLAAVSFARRFSGIPALCHIRDIPPDWLVGSRRYRKFVKYIDGMLAISNAVSEKLSINDEAGKKVVLLHNAIDIAAVDAQYDQKAMWRKQLNITDNITCFGIIGRLHPEKGIEELLEAFAQIASDREDVCLIVAGSDNQFKKSSGRDYENELKCRAQQLEIAGKVHFIGFIRDIVPLIGVLDVVVVPSWNEPFGRVAVEAMILRKPVIGANSGGLSDIVQDRVSGLLVEPRNSDALLDAMKFMLSDNAVREKMGEAGRLLAEEKFSYKKYMPVLETCYEALLEKS